MSSSVGLGDIRKPRRSDLYRTVHQGIEGTSMPAFNLLANTKRRVPLGEGGSKVVDEIDAIVSYVIHLSLRGETEFHALAGLLQERITSREDLETFVTGRIKLLLVDQWAAASEGTNLLKPTTIPPAGEDRDPQSIEKGYNLFLGKGACIKCHEDFGRQVPFKYDVWGTLVRPANLTMGTFRGGRRPIDLFWRVRGGIPPAAMPSAAAEVTDAEVWHIVHFLQALPHPAMLPDELSHKIYPGPSAKGHGETASVHGAGSR
jgi:mono/diheme cytochrome c family protein